jgi:hypothetical protein
MTETQTEERREGAAPYASFTTLMNTVRRMAEEGGVPSRVDRSYLANMPGGVRSTFTATMKAFGFIDDELRPTDDLIAVVAAKDEDVRKNLVAELVRRTYPGPLSLPPMATQAQLETSFRQYGISGSTLRRAIAFFLAATEYAGIRRSPHFKVPKREPGERTTPKPKPTAQETPQAPNPNPPKSEPELEGLHPFIVGLIKELPPPGGMFPPEKQEAWFAIAKATFRLIYNVGASDDATVPITLTPSDGGGDRS